MTPQHLQQGDQYHEAMLQTRMRALAKYDWGITDVQFDERLFTSGQIKIVKCHGIFPDGMPFLIGDRGEDVVESRPVEGNFPAAIESLDVFLAVPNVRDQQPNTALDAAKVGPAVRFVAQQATVSDLNTGRNEQSFTWARANMRLLFGTESRDAFHTIRIAQLERDRSGAVVCKEAFVPSLLRIGGSKWIMSNMRKLLDRMVGRQKELAESRRMRTASAVDFQASDTMKFWMLHTLNSYIPIVSHTTDRGDAHPEDLYVLLGSILGELCTFAPNAVPTDLPKFNYLEITESLAPMFERAIRMIEELIAESYTIIPLDKRPDGMYLGQFKDPTVPRTHDFFLECQGTDEATLRERLPKLLKVADWQSIGHILNAAIPGVRCEVEYRPPGAIPVKPGIVYLRVETNGDYWNRVLSSGTIALYHNVDPQKVAIRLIGVKQGS